MNKLIAFFILVAASVNSQNWNVFNKNYRYNYKFDNSQLISNVLIADTIKIVGTDTLYSLNRIGVESGNGFFPDQAQFLQKTIKKFGNGSVQLSNPDILNIIPTCTLNQTWIFDASTNYSAICISVSSHTYFTVSDSLKVILINNADTIKLSKQFGIIQFPKLYSLNKYYRLVGIEKAKRYDSIPLYGEKVPNAWDFYNFNIGNQRCFSSSYIYGTPQFNQAGCKLGTQIFYSKTILPNGYFYDVVERSKTKTGTYANFSSVCDAPAPWNVAIVTFSTGVTHINLSEDTVLANRMYPGMYLPGLVNDVMYKGIVKFGLDNNGTFYKYFGAPCQSNNSTILPNQAVSSGNGIMFGVGLGKTTDSPWLFEASSGHCVTCFTKGNANYFGPFTGVGIEENKINEQHDLIYPNPANSHLVISIDALTNVKLYNSIGILFIQKVIESKTTLDVSELPNGIYFIEFERDSYKTGQKIIIQH